jgi:methionine-rich copper-binding protein CopC
MRIKTLALAALILAAPGLAAPAFAHARLVQAVPAADGMAMPPPAELRLTFSEAVELSFTKVRVIGPDKKPVETGKPSLDPKDKATVVVPLAAPLADGAYTVEWQALSADGHKTRGSYRFESMK